MARKTKSKEKVHMKTETPKTDDADASVLQIQRKEVLARLAKFDPDSSYSGLKNEDLARVLHGSMQPDAMPGDYDLDGPLPEGFNIEVVADQDEQMPVVLAEIPDEDEEDEDELEEHLEPVAELLQETQGNDPIADMPLEDPEVLDAQTGHGEEEPPVEEKPAEPKMSEVALKLITALRSEISKSAPAARPRVASGSRARPNSFYVLLKEPVKWDGPPQVASLIRIMFNKGVLERFAPTDDHAEIIKKLNLKPGEAKAVLSEPEMFALIEAGTSAGVLKTTQPPVRIFQYYRQKLLDTDTLRWV